ncbi:MAG: hypothetical protein HY673_19155 [Chloroflexi bacterium]|nr:hypothetical protein [Chloroflexota bacterium]
MAIDKTDFEKQEEQLRSVLLRALIGFFIALATLLFAGAVPFYPFSFAVILALALGGLAYRAPALSLGLMFLLNLPGYLYQGGLPMGLVVVTGLVFLAATLTCLDRPGACLVIAAGVIAAAVMFTSVYFLSIPILVSVILFRARGLATGSPLAILVFLAIYNPYLALTIRPETPADIVPLFQQIQIPPRDPILTIELGQMITQLKEAIGRSENIVKNLTFYWPLVVSEPGPEASAVYSLVGRPLGFVLYFVIALSVSVAFGALSIFRWMASRDLGTRYLSWIAPTLSLLIADVGFLLPISTFAASFAYTTTLQGNITFLLVLATIGIGVGGSAIEYGLKTRDVSLKVRKDLTDMLPIVRRHTDQLQQKLSSIRELATLIDFHAQDKLVAVSAQELSYIEDRAGVLPTIDLQEKIKAFTAMQESLQKAQADSEQKLVQFYDESREKYETYVARSKDLGIVGIEVHHPRPGVELAPLGFDRVKEEQAKLNEAFHHLAECLVSIGRETASLISSEVDPEFKPFGLDIAQNYLATHHSLEAIDSMLSTFLTMRDVLDKAAADVFPHLQSAVRTWQAAIIGEALPTLKMIGDEEFIQRLEALEPMLDNITVTREERQFARLVLLVKNVKELNQAMHQVVSLLTGRIRDREKIIETKVPPGFDWEKNTFLPQKIVDVQEQLARKPKEASLGNRLLNIELALNTIAEGVALVRHYIFENEFLINFSNIQYLISLRVDKQGVVTTAELPVKEKYAHRYLVLYTRNHYDRVTFDSHRGILKTLDRV